MADDMKVVSIKRPVNRDCVERIEELLADAKDGKLQDIAACGVMIDGSLVTAMSSTNDAPLRLAAVARLLHRLHMTMDESMRGRE